MSSKRVAAARESEVRIEYRFIVAGCIATERHHWRSTAIELTNEQDGPPDYVIDLTAAQGGGLISGSRFGERPWTLPLSAEDLRITGRMVTHAGATMEAEVRIHDCGGGRRILYRIIDGVFVESEVLAWTGGTRTEHEGRLILSMRLQSASQLLLGEEATDDYVQTTQVGGHLLLLGCLAGLLSPPDLGAESDDARDVTAMIFGALESLPTVTGSRAADALRDMQRVWTGEGGER